MTPRARFTLDGSDELESFIASLCQQVKEAVLRIVPQSSVEGLLLGGGYGRGEGGVLRTPEKDLPYNDLEFYLLVRGHLLLNERRFGHAIHLAAEELSKLTGIEVEIKLLSLDKLRRPPATMFYYDLYMGHRWIIGADALLESCSHLKQAELIPRSEATRLLMNRCSGLLFSKERLQRSNFTPDDADFVGRNLAKARLGFGDALLAAEGLYDWSCLERHKRLDKAECLQAHFWYQDVLEQHRFGVEFKLHPYRAHGARETLADEHAFLEELGWNIWAHIESQRLSVAFPAPEDYAISYRNKCPETQKLRNALVNVKAFGLTSMFNSSGWRYPRERLLRSLPLLLWSEDPISTPVWRDNLHALLMTDADNFAGFVEAYTRLWRRFN